MKCNGIREDWCTTLPDSVTLHPGYIIAISQQNSDLALVLDPGGKQPISDIPPPKSSVSILIGPEGGLNDGERDQALQQEFPGLRLGPRILRTETAPLAAIAAIQTLWGDFKVL